MRFEYFEPAALGEAREILREGNGELKPFCGGTDIVIQLRRRVARWRGLVNLKRIPGLSEWQYQSGSGLQIGACTTMRDLEVSGTVRDRFPSLWESLRVVGSLQLRNLASVGGNLCNASPSADTAPPLIALHATVYLCEYGSDPRAVPVEDFFKGPGTSVLGPSELLLSISVPESETWVGSAFERFTPRSAMDIAIASAAAQVALGGSDGKVDDVRIALGAVAPTPVRARRAEDWLRQREPTDENFADAARLAMRECSPIDDIRASAVYRRELVGVLVKRVLCKAAARAKEGVGYRV